MTDPLELIFVHGALVRDGAWWWERTADLLVRRTGIRSRSVMLPSCGEASDVDGVDLAADALALRRELDAGDRAIVVGHSYGGTVIAEAGRHPAVERLVFVSSYLPDIGMAQATIMADEPDAVAVEPDEEGRLHLAGYTEATFAERFLQDADAAAQRGGWERVVPQWADAFLAPTTTDGWRDVDSTYLVCTEDRSTTPELQRFYAARATRSIELPTGHHPFLSRPDLVVEAIESSALGG